MQNFKVEFNNKIIPVNNKVKYKISSFIEIKNELATVKSLLDNEFKKPLFDRYWRECDPFKNERKLISQIGNTYNVSNAWIKCYEILNYFNIIPEELKDDQFIHFDNAAFPGAFIISTDHLIKTRRLWYLKYKWYGSSLINSTEQDKEPLEDRYELYKNYPNNWLMHSNNNGDVLSMNNQYDFKKKIGGKVDLYTSDLGFNVESDYNNQELLHCKTHIGQILSGLLTLRKGGSFFVKQYTFFESITISIIYATSVFFEEFYICKPYSSREANSETYLIGKNFKGSIEENNSYLVEMINRVNGKTDIEIPIFDAKYYSSEFKKILLETCKKIFLTQCDKIKKDIEIVNEAISKKDKNNPKYNKIIVNYMSKNNEKLINWYDNNIILPMIPDKMLKMKM